MAKRVRAEEITSSNKKIKIEREVNKRRVKVLSEVKEPRYPNVAYWMSRDQRVNGFSSPSSLPQLIFLSLLSNNK